VIQGRSFNADGSLFYPDNRAFFEGLNKQGTDAAGGQFGNGTGELQIDMNPATSDIAPIWNPEAFFNTMVVNGVTWPKLEVAPAQYRFRLLNGTNARFLNLALKITDAAGNPVTANKKLYTTTTRPAKGKRPASSKVRVTTVKVAELDFFQIGAEQSLKPSVTAVRTGFATNLTGPGSINKGQVVNPVPQSSVDQALLMGVAERADVIVDFRGLPDGTVITMTNTAPDAPFGGFPDVPADPSTTGQVMQFVVNSAHLGLSPTDEIRCANKRGCAGIPLNGITNPLAAASEVTDLVVDAAALEGFDVNVTNPVARDLALIEESSALICVDFVGLDLVQLTDHIPVGDLCQGPGGAMHATAFAMGPMAAVLGTGNTPDNVTLWSDPITTNVNPTGLGDSTETWNLHNFTADAHPIHVHLVKFKVLGRSATGSNGGASVAVTASANGTEAWEDGWKDTVVTYPGDTTTLEADFDINGLYVWHCHIVEHEDNEMMVPLCVGVMGEDCPTHMF
jgi:FtsP/CotA-like multicopper oxidase with cupredoxin domain